MKFSKIKTSILLSSGIIALSSVILLYKASFGINFVLYNGIVCLILLIIGIISHRLDVNLFISILLLFLVGVPFVITTSIPIRTALIIVMNYFLLVTLYSFILNNSQFEFWRYLAAPFEVVVMSWVTPLVSLLSKKIPSTNKLGIVLRILLGVVIAVPFLVLFIVLLSSADLAFKDYISNIFSWGTFSDIVMIVIRFVLTFWVFCGALIYILIKKRKTVSKTKDVQQTSSRFIVEGSTILCLVELLFLIFNIIQLTYLFGGESLITNGKFTYSEYARKGFFELIAVSVIALSLIAFIFKIKKAGNKVNDFIIRALGVFGLIELMPMTASAFYRLYLYESEYGFTRLRVYSHAFIIFLFAVFILFGVKFLTKLKETHFLYGIELISIIALILTGFVNVDGLITRLNIHKYTNDTSKDAEIDLQYLYTLSYDAVPELVNFFKTSQGDVKEETAFYLLSKYYSLQYDDQKNDVRSWNLSEYKSKKLIEDNLDQIENYSTKYEGKIYKKYKEINANRKVIQVCDETLVTFISKDGMQKWYYSFDISDSKLKKALMTTGDSFDNCIRGDINEDEYFLIGYNNDLFSDKEIFVFTLQKNQKELILYSRK